MLLFSKAEDLSDYLIQTNKSIGFVPTMGALHQGHFSLIAASKSQNEITVCSIYVNPTQFNNATDLEKYPRKIENDIEMLKAIGCDVLFLPSDYEIYPNGMEQLKDFHLGHLEFSLEGASRPGHFKGVANVVERLLKIVTPAKFYLGQKDFQQIKVIERMMEKSEIRSQIVICPIIREHDGLAMSSRNIRLTDVQRKNAVVISQVLFSIEQNSKMNSLSDMKDKAIATINSVPEMRVDYFEFCNADSFEIIESLNIENSIVCVTAVLAGDVRLLDNIILK